MLDHGKSEAASLDDAGASGDGRASIDWRSSIPAAVAGEGRHDHTHRWVLTVIEQRIVDGSLRAGDRLPGERDLAELLGVSRNSVREALRALESVGIVERGPGRGPSSGCIITGGPSAALSSVLRLHLALAHFSLADLVDVRVQLEMQAVHQAAAHEIGAQDEVIRMLIEAMADETLSPGEFNQLDTQFHIAVSSASGNPLLMALMQGLRDAVQHEMVAASERLSDWTATARRLHDEHESIANAMRAGDGDKAAALAEQHIRTFYGITNSC